MIRACGASAMLIRWSGPIMAPLRDCEAASASAFTFSLVARPS